MSPAPLVELHNVTKQYLFSLGKPFTALSDVSLDIVPGEFVAVLGKSGSGKSTLLNLVAGLDRPTKGEVCVAGTPLQKLNEDALAVWRRRNVGVVFQFLQLLPTLTVIENVMLAMEFRSLIPRRKRRGRAAHLLELVGIASQADKLPAMLSGGEQQRAAIARALANDPPLLIADEPTGNLDSKTANSVLDLFAELVSHKTTLLIVTHDQELASRAHRVVHLADGVLVNKYGISKGGRP